MKFFAAFFFAVSIASAQSSIGKFDFTPPAIDAMPSKGFTRVTPDTWYSADRGYGFEEKAQTPGRPPYYFSVKVPAEGNYRVTITLGAAQSESDTTVKAELRRLMLEKIRTAAGKFETRTFIVNTRTPNISADGEVKLKDREKTSEAWEWDDKLTLEFTGPHPAVRSVDIEKADPGMPTLYIAGDSTSTDQPLEPFNSWGQMITRFFRPEIAIANNGESGESLRSFIGERRFDKVMSVIKPGDFLLIQMGHNDQKEKGEGVGAFTTYAADLKMFIDAARKHGATPILITPVSRLAWGTGADEKKIINNLGDYPEAVRKVGREENVPVIDLNAMSRTFYEALGPADAHLAFAGTDTTHHDNYGSYELAKCIVTAIKKQNLPIEKYLFEIPIFDPARPDPIAEFDLPAETNAPGSKPYGQ
jgi:lysophospholipase L1-like esterase